MSTGLADNPVRAISFSLAGVGGQAEDDWFVVEDDQALLRVVGGTIRDGGVSMATSLEEVVSSFPKMPIHVSSDGAGTVHPDPTPARVNVTMDTVQQSRTVSIEEELIHHINHSSDKKKLFGVKWIHFIDSGGQLQYHDILPLFIQKPAVAIFVLNLSEELSHQPTIKYYGADGKPDARPLIITVGTHRDAADRQFSYRIQRRELKEVVLSVNGKTPQDVDRRFAKVVLTKVSEIVEYHHKLLYRPDEVELLNKFSKHYTEGLFIAQDLLKLLVSVGAIAMVGDEGIEYLMPALLPHLDSGQVTKYCQPAFIPNQPFTLEATVVSKKKWKCSIRGHQRGDLCEGQLMWFGESGVMKQDPSAAGTVPVTLDSEPSLQHLMEKVAAVIPSKYEMVGLQLGLTLAQLQAIRPQHQSLGDYHRAFGEIFNEWRRQGHLLTLGDIDWCVEKCKCW
eukprot:Em1101g2a